MAILKTDSPLCRRIVLSFLDFLNSVEPVSEVDLEGLEVAKECLVETFKLDSVSADELPKSDSLIDIFSSRIESGKLDVKSFITHERFPSDAPSTSSVQHADGVGIPEASQILGEDSEREHHTLGMSKDELFGQFCCALDKVRYFRKTPDGPDDPFMVDRATTLFHNALKQMQTSGCEKFDLKSMADAFKSQGNQAMKAKLYNGALELYTIATALCDDNAVFYSNRAAAFTQLKRYTEAINDCYESIKRDPNYSKAYSRLGFAYYSQGNYRDSIDKGFRKALLLDPNNDAVKENIRMAEQKLEEQQRSQQDQSSSSTAHSNQNSSGESGSYAQPPPFTSMPFSGQGFPAEMATLFRNLGASIHQGQHSPVGTEQGSYSTSSEPDIQIGGSININLGNQMPEDISGALRSVMNMFSEGTTATAGAGAGAAAPSVNPQDNLNGRPAPT